MEQHVPTEVEFERQALAEGFEVIRGGWPDYIIVRGDEVIFVEVKSESSPRLSAKQVRVLGLLQRLGLKVRLALEGDLGVLCTLDEYMKAFPKLRSPNQWDKLRKVG